MSAHAHTYGIEAVICRGSNNYGPRQYPEKLIPLMILNALARRPPAGLRRRPQVRNWLYVEDFCRGIDTVLEQRRARARRTTSAGRTRCENLEVVQRILELTGRDESLIEYVTDRPGHDRRYSLSSRSERELGWEAQVRFEEGLQRDRRLVPRQRGLVGADPLGRVPRVLRAPVRAGAGLSAVNRLEFDDRVVKQLEEAYQKRDMRRRRRLVQEALGPAPGERILDVGCGPGLYVADLLDAVGPEGSVVGVDGSPASLAVAAARSQGRHNVAFHESDATSLAVPDAEFDAALTRAGARVRARRDRGATRDPPCAAARRQGRGVGRGLGHRVDAIGGPGPHEAGAGGLGLPPDPSLAPANPHLPPP